MAATAFDQMLQSNAPDDSGVPKNDAQFKQEAGKQIKIAKEAETEREGLEKKEEALLSNPPINPYSPKPEDFKTPIADQFSSAGMLVATLGSLFTRHSLTSAANSMAGVLNSYNTGDMVKYKEAYDKWKTDNENAMKMADWEKDNLKTISELLDKKEKGAESTINLMAKAMGNPTLENAVRAGQVQEYVDKHKENILKTQKAIGEFDLQQGLVQDRIDALGHPPSKAELHQIQMDVTKEMVAAKKPGTSGGTLSNDDLEFMAKQYLAGDKSVLTGLGYGNAGAGNRAALRGAITAEAKDQGMTPEETATKIAEYQGLTAGERTISQREANVDMFAQEAKNMGSILRESSKAVSRSDFIPLGNGEVSFDVSTGSPAAAAYVASLNSYINAYAKAVNGGSAPLVSDKEHARDFILKGMGDEQLNAVLDVLDKEMDSALKAPGQVKEQMRNEKKGGSASSGGAAPDGTIITDSKGNTHTKVGGKWNPPLPQ